jgi:hypothetical protein
MLAPRRRITMLALGVFAIALIWPILTQGADPKEEPIDFQKARQLYGRAQAGETLTADEKAYVQRAMAEQRRRNGGQNDPPQGNPAQANLPKPPPPADSVDMVPLTDLGADGKYKGFDGALRAWNEQAARGAFEGGAGGGGSDCAAGSLGEARGGWEDRAPIHRHV